MQQRRQRAPRLTASDRLLFGFGSLFLSPGRIRKVAIGVRPSTLLGGPSVHPRSGGRDREAECAGDLVRAARRIRRMWTVAGGGWGPRHGR